MHPTVRRRLRKVPIMTGTLRPSTCETLQTGSLSSRHFFSDFGSGPIAPLPLPSWDPIVTKLADLVIFQSFPHDNPATPLLIILQF